MTKASGTRIEYVRYHCRECGLETEALWTPYHKGERGMCVGYRFNGCEHNQEDYEPLIVDKHQADKATIDAMYRPELHRFYHRVR